MKLSKANIYWISILILFYILFLPISGIAKDIFIRPPYGSGGVAINYGIEDGSDYDNAFPGPQAFNWAISEGRIKVVEGDVIYLLGGQYLYAWYDVRNDINLEVDNYIGTLGNEIKITGKKDGFPDSRIFGLYYQNRQEGASSDEVAWYDENLWKNDADDIKPVIETKMAIGAFYNEFTTSGSNYTQLIDLDHSTDEWRYYHSADSWTEFVSAGTGTYYTLIETFSSPYNGSSKTTGRIWIKPFSNLTSTEWADRAVFVGTSKAFSAIDISNGSKYVDIEDLTIYFAANPNGTVIAWKTPEVITEHIRFRRCKIWSNYFAEDIIIQPENVNYLTIEDSDIGYGRTGIIYFRADKIKSRYIYLRRNYFHHSGGNPFAGDLDWPNYGENTYDCHAIGHQADTQDIYIEDNYFYLVGTAIESHSALPVENFHVMRNTFYKVGRKYVANNFASGRCIVISGLHESLNQRKNHYIAYNIAYDSQGFLATNQASPLYIYNNAAINVGEGFFFENNTNPMQIVLENNLVAYLDTDQPNAYDNVVENPRFVKFQSHVEGSFLKANNNLFFDKNNINEFTFRPLTDGVYDTNLDAFSARISETLGSSALNNTFENPLVTINTQLTNGNIKGILLTLEVDSPLKMAGAEVSVEMYPSIDLYGNQIPLQQIPIGPYCDLIASPNPPMLN